MTPRSIRILPSLLVLTSMWALACDPGTTGGPDQGTRLSVYLTDAPGDVAAIWVDVTEIYFQGGPGGRLVISETPTGLIELLALRDHTAAIVTDLAIDPGVYSQLRFVLGSAVLETTSGEVYAFGGAVHPGGLDTTGELKCPSCTQSGIKVKLAGDAVEMEEGENAILLDFDVSQSLGRRLGSSGKWMLGPVIHATKVKGDDPEDPDAGGSISGTVVLGTVEGQPVSIPTCPEGETRTIRDFIPLATAHVLTDGEGGAIVRAGEVDEDGTFEIEHVEADTYTMGFQTEIELNAFKLVFGADVAPAEVSVAESEDVEGVAYTIVSATCEANAGG